MICILFVNQAAPSVIFYILLIRFSNWAELDLHLF